MVFSCPQALKRPRRASGPASASYPGVGQGKERVVVALGGNAFTRQGRDLSMRGQFQFARHALRQLLPIFDAHHEVLLCHGNGPQVGYMLIRVEQALGAAYNLPLEVCVAESEGELGYVLQQSLHNVLAEVGQARPVVSVLTQVVVHEDDPAFSKPEKPIGPFYDQARAQALIAQGFTLVQDSGRGFRRVVPSPRPQSVVELEVLRSLLDDGTVVIAAGGGGIPVVFKQGELHGVDAVVDKDLSSALLADRLGAQRLIIITGVPCAYLNFGTAQQEPIGEVCSRDVRRWLDEGQFGVGSMRPKMQAALQFASLPGREAIICDPDGLEAAMAGRGGTRVVLKG